MDDLVKAASILRDHGQAISSAPDSALETIRARRFILATATKLQSLLFQPVDFLQHLAGKVIPNLLYVPRTSGST